MSQRLLPAIGSCAALLELQLGSSAGCECHGTNIEGGIIQDAQLAALAGLRQLECLELDNIIRLSGAAWCWTDIVPSYEHFGDLEGKGTGSVFAVKGLESRPKNLYIFGVRLFAIV